MAKRTTHEQSIASQDPARTFTEKIATELALLSDHRLHLLTTRNNAADASDVAGPTEAFDRGAAIKHLADAMAELADAALQRHRRRSAVPLVADVAAEIAALEAALRGSAAAPASLRPETWGILLGSDYAPSATIRLLQEDSGSLRRGEPLGSIGNVADGDQQWIEDPAGTAGEIGTAVRRAYAAGAPANLAIERLPDIPAAILIWLSHVADPVASQKIDLSAEPDVDLVAAVATARRSGVAELLADALSSLGGALRRQFTLSDTQRQLGRQRIDGALPNAAWWLVCQGLDRLWPDATQRPTAGERKILARILVEVDLAFREGLEDEPEPALVHTGLVRDILAMRRTLALIDVARPRIERLWRGCEVWQAELRARLEHGAYERGGSGGRSRRGLRKIPHPLHRSPESPDLLVAIEAALVDADLIEK